MNRFRVGAGCVVAAGFLVTGCASTPKVTTACVYKSVDKEGGLEPLDIKCVVNRDVLPKLQVCYLDFLRTYEIVEPIEAKSVFDVDRGGKAQNIVLEQKTPSKELDECFVRSLADAQFPTHKASTPVNVRYPFLFRPKP